MKIRRLYVGILFSALAVHTEESIKVNSLPMTGGGAIEMGQIYGVNQGIHDEEGSIPDQWTLHRTLGWFSKQAVINDRLTLKAGVGGAFYYIFPYNNDLGANNVRRSAVSITELSASYVWGDLVLPAYQLTLGQQPYKYNPDAKNLGEYIFRTQAYPTLVYGGSWNTIQPGGAYTDIWGANFRMNALEGALKQDILATFSVDIAPLYDVSLSYIASLKIGSVLELGAGINFNRILPNRPSITTPKEDESTYFKWDGCPAGNCKIWIMENTHGDIIGDTTRLANLAPGVYSKADPRDSVKSVALSDSIPKNWEYISFKDTKFMFRLSFDPKPLLGDMVFLGEKDLRLYMETALIGLKNYPLYYQNRLDRTPIMVGFNLPAFKLLDVLSVEVERMTNPWLNDAYQVWWYTKPIPNVRKVQSLDGVSLQNPKPWTRDDIKWSINASKRLRPFELMLQVASDHLRPIDRFGSPVFVEALPENWKSWSDWGAWYYSFRLQMEL